MRSLFFILFGSLPALAAALTWDQAVEEAVRNHPGLKAAAADVRSSEANKLGSRSGFLPRLDASADVGRSGTEAIKDGDGMALPPGEFDRESSSYSGGLRASWRLFDGFGTLRQLQEAGYNLLSRQASLSQEEVDALRQLRVAFIRVLAAQGQLAVTEDIRQRREVSTKYQKLKFESGRQARWTWKKAEADELDAKWRVNQARLDLDVALQELAQALGRDRVDELSAEGSLATAEPPLLDMSRLDALPSLKRLRFQRLAAEARVGAAKAAHWPSLSANAGWNYSGVDVLPPVNRHWSLGLSAGFNLFNGGSTQYAVEAAQENLESLTQQEIETRQSLKVSILRAHARAVAAARHVAVADANLEASRERYDTVVKLSEAGRAGYLDIEQAESGLAGAQQQGLALRQEASQARADLDAALGFGINDGDKEIK